MLPFFRAQHGRNTRKYHLEIDRAKNRTPDIRKFLKFFILIETVEIQTIQEEKMTGKDVKTEKKMLGELVRAISRARCLLLHSVALQQAFPV